MNYPVVKPAPQPIDLADRRVALFFDVDGTLVNTNFHEMDDVDENLGELYAQMGPSDVVREAIHQAALRGHKSFICTGRTLDTVFDSLMSLDIAGVVSGAGSCVSMDGKILYERAISPELLEQTARILFDEGVPVIFEGNDGSIVTLPQQNMFAGMPGLLEANDFDELMELAQGMTFEKFSYQDTDVKKLEGHMDFFRSHYSVCDLGVGGGEMTMLGVDKGVGVRHALELLGEGPWLSFGFGDSENDLEMMRTVDIPVAMGNALPSVKEVSLYETDHVADDGVATALAAFGLI